jgi:glucosamine--fructose-6-phosphate aminotransferase (isomerizing)
MNRLIDELMQQPTYLRSLVEDYRRNKRIGAIRSLALPPRWILTGMGASFHAGWIGSYYLNSLGIPASACETTDLMNYTHAVARTSAWTVYVSQSGSSGEITPFLESLPAADILLSITNNPLSELARRGSWFLPMDAGEETLVASKTYINPLAILWLLGREVSGKWDGSEYSQLLDVADRVERILAQAQAVAERMVSTLDDCSPVLFLGHGPHSVTARQSAMVLSEWAKLPALHAGVGAFRHGFIETIQPGFGVVLFAAPGQTAASSLDLANELSQYGARVLLVENGCLQELDEPISGEPAVDEFLSPILDIIPIQLYADGLAKERQIEPGFRYISKVVQRL